MSTEQKSPPKTVTVRGTVSAIDGTTVVINMPNQLAKELRRAGCLITYLKLTSQNVIIDVADIDISKLQIGVDYNFDCDAVPKQLPKLRSFS